MLSHSGYPACAALYMAEPSHSARTKHILNVLDTQLAQEAIRAHIILGSYTTDPSDHGTVISSQADQGLGGGCPGLTAM